LEGAGHEDVVQAHVLVAALGVGVAAAGRGTARLDVGVVGGRPAGRGRTGGACGERGGPAARRAVGVPGGDRVGGGGARGRAVGAPGGGGVGVGGARGEAVVGVGRGVHRGDRGAVAVDGVVGGTLHRVPGQGDRRVGDGGRGQSGGGGQPFGFGVGAVQAEEPGDPVAGTDRLREVGGAGAAALLRPGARVDGGGVAHARDEVHLDGHGAVGRHVFLVPGGVGADGGRAGRRRG